VMSGGAAVFGAEPATGFGCINARIMAGLGRETFAFDAEACLTPPRPGRPWNVGWAALARQM
jgi:hypothetical protein